MNRHGALWVGLLLLAITFAWISYSTDKQQAVKMDNPKVVQGKPAVQTPAAPVPEVIEATGIYVGRTDNSFIEIVVGDGAKAYYYPADTAKVALFGEDSVTFRYYEDEQKKLVITSIQVNPPTPSMGEGVFNGLINDNGSIQIINGDTSQTFQLTSELKKKAMELTVGDKVMFGVKTVDGQNVITWITKQ